MGHAVQALVFPRNLSTALREKFPPARTVRLDQELIMLPISDIVLEQLGRATFPAELPIEFTRLSVGVLELARELSNVAPVAYVETDYFGGTGSQSAAAWHHGQAIVPPTSAEAGVINTALRALGVDGAGFHDEFEAVGLQRFRDNEGWLERGEPG